MCPPCPRTCVHHVSGPYKKRQSNPSAFAPSYGLRCAQVPSFRLCSVGTPPRAIHGPSRLSRHPCRSTHSAEPPLGLPGGLADQKHCATRQPTGRPVRFVCAAPSRSQPSFLGSGYRNTTTVGASLLAPTIGLDLQQSIYRDRVLKHHQALICQQCLGLLLHYLQQGIQCQPGLRTLAC